MKPRIFVTRKLPSEAIKLLSRYFEIDVNPENKVLTKEELLKGVKGVDGLVSLLTDRIDAQIMDAAGDQSQATTSGGGL